MATTTIYGSVTGYELEADNGVTRYIRESALLTEEQDFLETALSDAGGDGSALETYLKDNTYPVTGRNAWEHFGNMVSRYNPSLPSRVAKQSVSEVSASYDQAEVNEIVDAVNAVRQLV